MLAPEKNLFIRQCNKDDKIPTIVDGQKRISGGRFSLPSWVGNVPFTWTLPVALPSGDFPLIRMLVLPTKIVGGLIECGVATPEWYGAAMV